MPKKSKKSKANKVPKSAVQIEKIVQQPKQFNNINTYAPYQVVPNYYSQFGANTWA